MKKGTNSMSRWPGNGPSEMVRISYESSSAPEVAAASRRRTKGVLVKIRWVFTQIFLNMMSYDYQGER
jgi:hypothetical protein